MKSRHDVRRNLRRVPTKKLWYAWRILNVLFISLCTSFIHKHKGKPMCKCLKTLFTESEYFIIPKVFCQFLLLTTLIFLSLKGIAILQSAVLCSRMNTKRFLPINLSILHEYCNRSYTYLKFDEKTFLNISLRWFLIFIHIKSLDKL